jgi:transketolase
MIDPHVPLAAAPAAAAASSSFRDDRAQVTPRQAHERMANAIRALAMDAVEQAKSGHPGLPMGGADIATVLFSQFLKFDPADPTWPDRDRFVLSAGHGSMLLYAVLHLLGYEKMTIDEIKRFRQLGSITPGHPENFLTPGVETTTGPLGQGLANAVGMAIGERHLAAVFGPELVDHRTYVLASDGDLMEGVSQEAIALAGHLRLNKLILLFDDNSISIDGPLSLADSVDQVKRFEAAALEALTAAVPEMIGGSADLTGSNNTKPKGMTVLSAADYGGRFIHYGVREHAMAAAMNGMALHGGVIAYSGTFLVFADYCRPAIRLAALMGIRVIHVMTHDSIGLGEDGPTHQPVEHLAALRAIPNLHVFRPCDAVETAECWQLALANSAGPSVLALTRQNLPQLRRGFDVANRCADGGYELVSAQGNAEVSLFATGSEVTIAVEAHKILAARGVSARVVSLPCFELFRALPAAKRKEIIGRVSVKVAVEAAIRQGWDEIIGSDGAFIGMTSFGASAPYKELYRHFGISAENVAKAALHRLGHI